MKKQLLVISAAAVFAFALAASAMDAAIAEARLAKCRRWTQFPAGVWVEREGTNGWFTIHLPDGTSGAFDHATTLSVLTNFYVGFTPAKGTLDEMLSVHPDTFIIKTEPAAE